MKDLLILLGIIAFSFGVEGRDDNKGFVQGDLMLGGLFPLHDMNIKGECLEHINFDGIFMLEAFYFSLHQINKHLKSCCGFKLGAITYDTCSSPRHGLYKAIELIMPKSYGSVSPVVAVVGPYHSSVAIQVANLLSMFRVIQISYGATSPSLSFRDKFPLFFRTVPSDEGHAEILVGIMKKMSWSYIFGIYEDSAFGKGFLSFEKLAISQEICFADKLKIDEDSLDARNIDYYRKLLRDLYKKAPTAHTMVLYLRNEFAKFLFIAAKDENLGNHFTFLGADGWGGKFIEPGIREVAEGSIISHHVKRDLPHFKEHFFKLDPWQPGRDAVNPWFKQFWEEALQCKVTFNDEAYGSTVEDANNTLVNNSIAYCQNDKDITTGIIDGTEFDFMHYVRDAVFAYGKAFENMHRDLCGNKKYLCYDMIKYTLLSKEYDSKKLMEYLENVTFSVPYGPDFKFENKQDGSRNYSLFIYAKNEDDQYYWKEVAIDIKALDKIDQLQFDRSYPESVCGRHCDTGFVRHIQHDTSCCWTCKPCPFPQVASNETHCLSCNHHLTMDNEAQFIYRRPNVFNNGCDIMTATVIGYDNNFYLGAVILSCFGVMLTLLTIVAFIYHINTPVIKASARELSAVLLSGILLCFLTVFLLGFQPSTITCASVRFMYSISYTVCYAAIFLKTNRIERIFNKLKAKEGGFDKKESGKKPAKLVRKDTGNMPTAGIATRTKYISPLSQLLLVFTFVGFQILLNAVWMFLKMPGPDQKIETDIDTKTVEVFIFCEAFEDQDMMVALTLPIILLIFTVLYAFKTRKIPGHFNETKYIIITTYTTFILWITFLPLFFATLRIDMRIFALAAAQAINATVTLICMFGPKLYIVLCRPHKNTKETVMGQPHRRRSWRWSVGQDSAANHNKRAVNFIQEDDTNYMTELTDRNGEATSVAGVVVELEDSVLKCEGDEVIDLLPDHTEYIDDYDDSENEHDCQL